MPIEEIINAIYHRDERVPQDIREDLHDALKINRRGIPGPARIKMTIVFYAFSDSNEEQEVKRQLWFKRNEENNQFEVTFKYFPHGGAAQRSIRLDQYDFQSNDGDDDEIVFRNLWAEITAFRNAHQHWANGNNFN